MPASPETQKLLKTIYDKTWANMIYTNRPLLGKFTKTAGGGDFFTQAIVYGESAGRSRDPAIATANKGRSKKAKFQVPFLENYHAANLSSLDMALTANAPRAAFAQAMAVEIEVSVDQVANDTELSLIRSKGVRGTVGSFATDTITLTFRGDAKNFFAGQFLQSSPTPGSTLNNAGAVATVLGVDEDAGTIKLTANANATWPAIANGHVLYQQGDAANGGADRGTLSIEDWIPLAAPVPGETFAGSVDRTVSTTKLSGCRIDARGLSARETMIRLASRIGEAEGSPDFALVPFSFWEQLNLEMESKSEISTPGTGNAATFGYRAIKFPGPNNDIMVTPHAKAHGDRVYQLTMKDWTLLIAGGGLDPIQNPIQNGKVKDDDFGITIEHMSVVYLACREPGHSGVARIA